MKQTKIMISASKLRLISHSGY